MDSKGITPPSTETGNRLTKSQNNRGGCSRCHEGAATTVISMSLLDDLPNLERALRGVADAERSTEMATYLKDQFPMLGVSAPERRQIVKDTLDTRTAPSHDQLVSAVDVLFDLPEREFHYCGMDLARRWQRVLGVDDLPWLASLISTHSWWDTVDALATHPVGHVVRNERAAARATIDRWAASDDLWLNRSAIIHQLMFKDDTDAEQLFEYCDLHAGSTEFFHRKAIGWALRQYSRTDPDAVIDYVNERREVLSGLSIREALRLLP